MTKYFKNLYFVVFSQSVDLNLTENNLNKILLWSSNRISNINELIHDSYTFIWLKPSESTLKSMDYDKGYKQNIITKLQHKQLFFI